MPKATSEDWSKRVERWKDSGLTAKEFASETGLNERSLSWWRWHLGAKAKKTTSEASPPRGRKQAVANESGPTTDASPKRRRRRVANVPGPAMTFVEVSAARTSELLEVVLVRGRRVRVPIGFDEATFERLVTILERSA